MKNKKLIGLASLMLALGATGCPDKTPEKCEKHTWGDKVTLKEATCTEAGESQRTCTVCGEKEEVKPIKALGHAYVDDSTGGKDPTCTEDGSKNQTCSRCGDKTTVKVNALGHDWVDDETGGTPATCTEAGTKNQHCSRCTETQEGVAVPALGHDFGDWTTVEGKAPTCEGKGEESRACKREGCTEVETREVDPLGHDFKLVGEATAPTNGKAEVRVYKCQNGCEQTSLGFQANEVTDASKARLTIGEDGGAAFWGRPIGNSLALKANGDSQNEQNNECVYCRDEQGDFFEYVFDLTADQAALLSTCRCYCDARPANYLSGDFWAYNASSDDWTPGYYIDDDDAHIEHNEDGTVKKVKNHTVCSRDSTKAGDETEDEVPMGKRITDYRYVLYVDGDVKDFDPSISVPVAGSMTNMTRKEYVMPYTFNLHEGENRISLRMAGGYRSTFYSFTFRPYVAPTDVVVNETELTIDVGATGNITSAMEGLTYTSSNPAVATVDENGVVTGVAAGEAKITVSKAGNYKAAEVNVTVNSTVVVHDHIWGNATNVEAVAGTSVAYTKETCECGEVKITMSAVDMDGKITQEGGKLPKGASNKYDGTAIARYVFNSDVALDGSFYAIGGVDNAGNYGYSFYTGKNASGSTENPMSDGTTNTVFKINGNAITVCADPYNKLVDLKATLTAGAALTAENSGLIKIGDATLAAGANTFTMAATNSYGISYAKIVFIGHAHEHAFGAAVDLEEGATDAAVKKYVCGCGVVKYEVAASTGNFALDGSSGWKDDNSNPTKSGFFKLASDDQSFHFTFNLPKGFVGKMYQRGYMDSYNSNKTKKLYYEKGVPNIAVTVNNAENPIAMAGAYPLVVEGKENVTYENLTFQDVFGDETNGSNSTVKDVYIGELSLATANTITYKRVKTVNLTVSHLVFIGTEVDA